MEECVEKGQQLVAEEKSRSTGVHRIVTEICRILRLKKKPTLVHVHTIELEKPINIYSLKVGSQFYIQSIVATRV